MHKKDVSSMVYSQEELIKLINDYEHLKESHSELSFQEMQDNVFGDI